MLFVYDAEATQSNPSKPVVLNPLQIHSGASPFGGETLILLAKKFEHCSGLEHTRVPTYGSFAVDVTP